MAEERPSVLEMENNYLLRHRQQQQQQRFASYDRWSSGERYDHYGRPGDHRPRALPGKQYNNIMSSSHVEPGMSRVRSEEMLGTRSEPDLTMRPSPLSEDCRWFVALFNYDHHMSPNSNAAQEELPFRKHQLIKVSILYPSSFVFYWVLQHYLF